jgi:magnesium chelatase subunit I
VQSPRPATLGALRESAHVHRGVRDEIRQNLLVQLASGRDRFPGVVGFDQTVLPQLERALLARHHVVLLGERGQGKTRLMRAITDLLDEWTPAVRGCEINDHPYAPACPRCQSQVHKLGEKLPIIWRHRSERYAEKLATPDTAVGDLLGDVDPIRVAEGRPLGDPDTMHYGLVPRANRGVFAINELPELGERIQVALLNVLAEQDIQIRGYAVRLPLDLLLIATANPEDYTNRGRIISPLKDRFGAEIRTHYPLDLNHEIVLLRQEAELAAEVPGHLIEIIARFTRLVRESSSVDSRSGVSSRFAVAAAETAAASALRRAALTGERPAVARVGDLPGIVETLRGKVEFEPGEEGREQEILLHLLRRATADTFRARISGADLTGLAARFEDGRTVTTGDLVPAGELLAQVGPVSGLANLLRRVGVQEESPALAAAALEFAMEGMHLNKRLGKEEIRDRTVYSG